MRVYSPGSLDGEGFALGTYGVVENRSGIFVLRLPASGRFAETWLAAPKSAVPEKPPGGEPAASFVVREKILVNSPGSRGSEGRCCKLEGTGVLGRCTNPPILDGRSVDRFSILGFDGRSWRRAASGCAAFLGGGNPP